MSKQVPVIVGVVVAIGIVGAAVWYFWPAPTVFPVSPADHLTSWALPVPSDTASSTPLITAQINQFAKMLGQGQYPDADIENAIGNDYAHLGDGEMAYQTYQRALIASSSDAVVYNNLGGLFARLYATTTATRAYAMAVQLAPTQLMPQLLYADYLAVVSPNDPATATAFASAKQEVGATNPNVLIAEASWLAGIGRTNDAIADLEAARASVATTSAAALIDTRITQLEGK